MPVKVYDCIIVGAGIAGSVTARVLLHAGYDILVIDNMRKGSSSMVAAGLVNPITGKRFELSWRFDECVSVAKEFYNACEVSDGIGPYLQSFPMLRFFSDEKERALFFKKFSHALHDPYVGHIFDSGDSSLDPLVNNTYGGFRTLQASIFAYQTFIEQTSRIFEERLIKGFAVNPKPLRDMWNITVQNKTYVSKSIIYCDGWQGSRNHMFADIPIPFDIVKGEMCIIKAAKLPETDIISRGFAIIPMGNQLFRCSATFQWNEYNTLPTAFGYERLQNRIHSLINCDYEILEQSAGLRPTMVDHLPFLGEHPDHPGLFIVGGLGSKGALFAPFMAMNLFRYIHDKQPLDVQLDIMHRFLHHEST